MEYKEFETEMNEGLNAIWCRVIIAQIIVLFLEAKYFLLAYENIRRATGERRNKVEQEMASFAKSQAVAQLSTCHDIKGAMILPCVWQAIYIA